jgi:hypothetical protein
MTMWFVSVVSLCLVFVLCVLGTFHGAFKDNVLQRGGMMVLGIASAGRVVYLWHVQRTVDPAWTALHIGIAIFVFGTAQQVVIAHGRERGWRAIVRFDRWLWKRKTGPGEFDDRPHHHVRR